MMGYVSRLLSLLRVSRMAPRTSRDDAGEGLADRG